MIWMELCDDIIERAWNSGKRKDETIETENLVSLRNKELNLVDETRIRSTLCVCFNNLIADKQRIWHTTYACRKD